MVHCVTCRVYTRVPEEHWIPVGSPLSTPQSPTQTLKEGVYMVLPADTATDWFGSLYCADCHLIMYCTHNDPAIMVITLDYVKCFRVMDLHMYNIPRGTPSF